MTLSTVLVVVLIGLLVATAGFFAGHAVASGWTGAEARIGRAQASSLYNLFYYAGSSLFGWLGGVFFVTLGWAGTAGMIAFLALIAGVLGVLLLSGPAASRKPQEESQRPCDLLPPPERGSPADRATPVGT